MKAERAKDRLAVKALWLEPRFTLSTVRRGKLDRELLRQARLGAVRDIAFPQSAVKVRSHFHSRLRECNVANRPEPGLAEQFSVELAATDCAQREARFQPQRFDREAVLCPLRFHVDASDEA